jgi:hypothetical protein
MLLVVAVALAGCGRGPQTCPVCQRAECKGMAFRMTLANGKTIETCCPRCGLVHLRNRGLTAKTMEATDYTDGRWIDATKAVYVSGSDVSHCAATEARRDAFGCCAIKGYDRCLPSLIAFHDKESAAAFQKQHGGQLVAFSDISAK